jgi:hypothetical protein
LSKGLFCQVTTSLATELVISDIVEVENIKFYLFFNITYIHSFGIKIDDDVSYQSIILFLQGTKP